MLAKRDTGEHTNDQFVFVSMVHQAEMQPVTARADHMSAWRAGLRAHGLDRPEAFAAITPSTRGVSISKVDFPSAAPCLPRSESLGRAGCAANRFTLGTLPPLQPHVTHRLQPEATHRLQPHAKQAATLSPAGCSPVSTRLPPPSTHAATPCHTRCRPTPGTLPLRVFTSGHGFFMQHVQGFDGHAQNLGAGPARPAASVATVRPPPRSCAADAWLLFSLALAAHTRTACVLRARTHAARTAVRTAARTAARKHARTAASQVHFTFQYSDTPDFPHGKRQRAREAALWTADPPSYYTEGRYVKLVGALYTAAQRVAIERRYPEWSPHRHMAIDAIQRAAVRDRLALSP